IQVSVAHAYPGTEFYEFAEKHGYITNETMNDHGGHQMAHIEYPGLPTEYVMEQVHRFYDEYYFRPKAAFRVVWKAIVNRDVPRLYQEAKSYMKLRKERYAAARAKAEENALKQQESVSMNA
ncbi:MAG TPA: hopanoid biosynthesis associated radical SAM protein HpnJ, partial [Terriglobus sp.]